MPDAAQKNLAERLKKSGLTLATAESCTGGLVAAAVTAVPGSSDYFLGGVVAYDNRIKMKLLGVPAGLLEEFGAVSRECALAMAEGARRALGADLAVASTGVAGPGGGSPEKPVGLVWLALAGPDRADAYELHLTGGRDAVRLQTVAEAERLLAEFLKPMV